MSRLSRIPLSLVLLLAIGCSAVAPGASPTSQPTDAPTASPTASATAAATASPSEAATVSPTANGTPAPTLCEDYYGDECAEPGSTTAPPSGDVAVMALTYGEIGAYLAGPTQMALYTFDNDSPGSSSCNAECAEAWPPLTVAMGEAPTAGPGITGELATIMRDDGTHQVTYDGAPLYYFAGDTQLYDVTGDGLNGVWHLARP